MKVLIIDDDQMIVEVWSVVLKENGFEVITASNGSDGINQAKSQKPNLVLLDEIMPDMLGNDVLQTLKGDPETNAIPIAIVSNYSEGQLMQEAIRQGAVDYILKYQVDPQDLVNKIKGFLQETNTVNITNTS
jgi:two-component system, OmpR family, alkaline phosphatase synthesis response regulator PhoP